nr:EAL domain-containing protein [Conexibacter arvalis]
MLLLLTTAVAIAALGATGRQLHRRALQRAEANLRTIFDTAPIGNAVLDARDTVVEANQALARITGFTALELRGRTLDQLVHPEDAAPLREALGLLRNGERGGLETEIRCLHASGHPVPAAVHAAALREPEGRRAPRVLLQVVDITERKRVEEHLQHMADHDPLTGLLNRRRFEQELERHVARARRYGVEGAVLVIDVDRFKQVNDAYGHSTGDRVITSVARVLRRRLRTTDTVARLGGDEFAVLLPKADRREAEIVARRLVEAVRAQAEAAETGREGVTISVGVAVLDERAELSAEATVVDADLAMYDAKDAGGDGWAFFSAEIHAHRRNRARTTWRDRIVDALANDRFDLVAQPVLDARTGAVVQHELLLRMAGPSGTLIPPAAFLQIAERDGLIVAIDHWVVRRAIALLAELEDRGAATRVEVNIAGRSLADATLMAGIAAELRATGVDPGNLVFEISEASAVADVQLARAFAQHVQGLGCQFAIDDFGAGLGSLYYLKHLPFDVLKLDGELVGNCARNPTDRLLVESAVRVVHGLGRTAVAEQVGDAETHALLVALDVDLVQGHHFAMPQPLATAFAPRTALTAG